jgi:hypothetical protein
LEAEAEVLEVGAEVLEAEAEVAETEAEAEAAEAEGCTKGGNMYQRNQNVSEEPRGRQS